MSSGFCNKCGAKKANEVIHGETKVCNDCKLIFIINTRKIPESKTIAEQIDLGDKLKKGKDIANVVANKVHAGIFSPLTLWLKTNKENIIYKSKRTILWILGVGLFAAIFYGILAFSMFAIDRSKNNKPAHLAFELDSLAKANIIFDSIIAHPELQLTKRLNKLEDLPVDTFLAYFGHASIVRDDDIFYSNTINKVNATIPVGIFIFDSTKNAILVKYYNGEEVSISENKKARQINDKFLYNWEKNLKLFIDSLNPVEVVSDSTFIVEEKVEKPAIPVSPTLEEKKQEQLKIEEAMKLAEKKKKEEEEKKKKQEEQTKVKIEPEPTPPVPMYSNLTKYYGTIKFLSKKPGGVYTGTFKTTDGVEYKFEYLGDMKLINEAEYIFYGNISKNVLNVESAIRK